jgi:hypothetical protein
MKQPARGARTVLQSTLEGYKRLMKRGLLEARVGIGRVPPSTIHSKSTVYIITDALIIKEILHFVNDNFRTLQRTFFNSVLLSTEEVCWHFCWHFSEKMRIICSVFSG